MPRRSGRVLAAFFAFALVGGIGAAFAFWSGTHTRPSAFAVADTVNAGNQPRVTPSGSSATVAWDESRLLSAATVDGYIVKRYDTGDIAQTVNPSCAGTIGTLSCLETNVPDGSWKYTVTPAVGLWRGTESAPRTVTVGATKLVFTSSAQTAGAGTSTGLITVQRQDASSVATTVGSRTVTLSSNAGTGTFRNAADSAVITTVTIPDGQSSVTLRYRDTAAGTPLITASSGTLTAATQNVTVNAAAASQLAFTAAPASATAGSAFSPQAQVTVQDTYGNTVLSATNSITLAIKSNTGTSGAVLSGCINNPVAAVNGVAQFAACSIDKSGTGYQLKASATGLASANSSSFDVAAGAAAKLVFSQQPTSAVAGSSITPSVTVRIEDANGNLTTSTASVLIGFGTNAGSGTLNGTTTVAAVNGVATFSGLSVDKAASGYTLHATSGTLTVATSTSFNITAATASKLVFGVQPSSTVAGAAIAPAVTVRVEDAFGNLTASTANVAMAVGTNPGGGTLTGTKTVRAIVGVATFSDLSINKVGTGYTLDASSSPLTAATSNTFNITPGAASVLKFSQQPTNTVAGALVTPAVTVRIEDAKGNLTASTASVTVAIGTNPGGGTLSGTKTVPAIAGVATFSDLSINKVGTGYTLTAAGTALTGDTSAVFNITVGAANKLTFSTQPTSAVAGVAISPAVTVRIEDAFGNVVTTSGATVGVAFTTPGGATLSGTSSVAASGGVATFSTLSVNKTGSYTLTATSTGLLDATSSSFTISAATPTKVVFGVQPSTTTAGSVITPAVTALVEDTFGNVVTTSTANVTMAIGTNPNSGTLSGTMVRAAVAGVATFNDLSINRISPTGTSYTLTAASTGLAGDTSSTFTIIVGTAAKLTFSQQPSSTVAGGSITPSVTVRIEDTAGNLTTSTSNVTIGIGTNPGGGALSGTFTVAASGGVATFTNLSINKTGTGYTLAATSAAVTGATSSTFNITPSTPNKLTFLQQPTTAAAGMAISPAVSVRIEDSFGNLTTSTANVVMAISANPGGGTLSGTLTKAALAGVATFSDLSINKTGSGYSLAATSASISGTTSSTFFDITPAAANKVAFGVQPTNTAAGSAITPAVTAQIQDTFGNVVTSSSANITVAIGTNPASGTLSGTLTVATVNGVAPFSTLKIDKPGTGYTLVATSTGLTSSGASSAFNIAVGSAAKLTFSQQPTNTVAGSPIAPAVTVRVEDLAGNLVTTSAASVTVAIGTNPGGGTLSGTVTVNASAGIATLSTLSISKPGTGYTLTAASSGLSGGTSGTFNITPLASQLVFLQQPTNAVAGATIAPAVTVRVEDQFGNLVTTSTATITIAIGTNPGGGTLSGTLSVNASGGVATFSNLSINKSGIGYTLAATTTGLTATGPSSTFNITAGAAADLKLTSGTNGTLTCAAPSAGSTICSVSGIGNGQSLVASVVLTDVFGNAVTNTSGSSIGLTTTSPDGTFTPSTGLSIPNNSSSSSSFTFLKTKNTATFTVAGTVGGSSVSITCTVNN